MVGMEVKRGAVRMVSGVRVVTVVTVGAIVTVGLVRSFLRVGCGLLFQGRGLLSGGRWCSRGGRRRGDLSGLRCRSFYVRCSGICLIGGRSASRWYRVCD